MTDSLELYNEAVYLATNNPTKAVAYAATAPTVLKNYYLQLVMTTFYELTTQRTSPLINALCHHNKINFTPKNFNLTPAQSNLKPYTGFDLFALVYGLNAALTKNLAEC